MSKAPLSAYALQAQIIKALDQLNGHYTDVEDLLAHMDKFELFSASGFNYLEKHRSEVNKALKTQTEIDYFKLHDLKYFKSLYIIANLISRNPTLLDDQNIDPLIKLFNVCLSEASQIYAVQQEKLAKDAKLKKQQRGHKPSF